MTLPTEPAPLEKMSTMEMVSRIHRAFNAAEEERMRRHSELEKMLMALEAKMDTAFVGADYNRHKTDHDTIHEAARDAKQLKKDLWARSITGLWMAFWGLVGAGLFVLLKINIGAGTK